MCIRCESISLKDADEHETLESYLKLWNASFGADEQMQRMKNVAADWADVGGDRSDPILQQLDELAREIGENLAFDPNFEKGYKAWEADLTEAERCVYVYVYVYVCVCVRVCACVCACLRACCHNAETDALTAACVLSTCHNAYLQYHNNHSKGCSSSQS